MAARLTKIKSKRLRIVRRQCFNGYRAVREVVFELECGHKQLRSPSVAKRITRAMVCNRCRVNAYLKGGK